MLDITFSPEALSRLDPIVLVAIVALAGFFVTGLALLVAWRALKK